MKQRAVLVADSPEQVRLLHGGHPSPLDRALRDDADRRGVVIFATGTDRVEDVARVAFQAWERRNPVMLVRRARESDRWPGFPANVIVDIEHGDWDVAVGLVATAFTRPIALLHGRDAAYVRWLRADGRPGAAINGVRWVIGWGAPAGTAASVCAPRAHADHWRRARRGVPFRIDVHHREFSRERSDVLVFLPMWRQPDPRAVHRLAVQELGVDARPYDAQLCEPVLPEDVAIRVAELHLRHESAGATVSMIRALAEQREDHDDDCAVDVYASDLADRVLGLLGFPNDADDADMTIVVEMASAWTRARCRGQPEPEWAGPD